MEHHDGRQVADGPSEVDLATRPASWEGHSEDIVTFLMRAFRVIHATGIQEDDQGQRFFWAREATEALRRARDPNPRETINRLVGCRALRYDQIGAPGRATCILVLLPDFEMGGMDEEVDAEEPNPPREAKRLPEPDPLSPVSRPVPPRYVLRRAPRPAYDPQTRQGTVPACLAPSEDRLWTAVIRLLSATQPIRTWNLELADRLRPDRLRREASLASPEFALACERLTAAGFLAPVPEGYLVLRNPRNTPVISLAHRPLVRVSAARLERLQAARRLAQPWIDERGCVPWAAQKQYGDAVAQAWGESRGRARVLEELVRDLTRPPIRQGAFDGSLFVRLSSGLHPFPAALAPADLVLTDLAASEELVPPGALYAPLLLRNATWRAVSG